ncbi:MAG: (2Fe-2S)-binding protein [Planctomycetota bacterium]|nr:(2Fe-2S)-binding protein [Planctomycetota bacterium]
MANTEGKKPQNRPAGFSRRRFLQGVGAVSAGAMLADANIVKAETPPASTAENAATEGTVEVTLNINGANRKVNVEPRTTLLSALRDRLDPALTGPKLVCNMGTCGACTVIMDGRTAYSCSVLAIDTLGKKITTVEGLGTPDHMNEVQKAFCEKDAMMCGFCTPGFVTTVSALLQTNPNPTLQEVREACHGNFCRCGTYTRVFEAALAAAKAGR